MNNLLEMLKSIEIKDRPKLRDLVNAVFRGLYEDELKNDRLPTKIFIPKFLMSELEITEENIKQGIKWRNLDVIFYDTKNIDDDVYFGYSTYEMLRIMKK